QRVPKRRRADSREASRSLEEVRRAPDRRDRRRFRSDHPSGRHLPAELGAPRWRGGRPAAARLHDWRTAAAAGDGGGGERGSKRDYYEGLGIAGSGTEVEIKSAYRKLAMKYRPDRNPGDKSAEEKFKEAAEAYAILCDGEKRSLYDRFGHQGVSSAAGAGAGFDPSVFAEFGDFADILGNMFGFGDLFGGGRRRGGPQRGADLRYDIE